MECYEEGSASPIHPNGLNNKLNDLDAEMMRDALTAIAQEIKRYRNKCDPGDYGMGSDLDIYKNKLKTKIKQVKTLKEHRKTACLVAKTVINAKNKEIVALNANLKAAKSDWEGLIQKNNEFSEAVTNLTLQNKHLNDKYQNLVTFIELGYKELQRMRQENLKELPILKQLKEIMVACGQYYVDFCNEREKIARLEQKNRFLTNKLRIMENNMLSVTADLKKLQLKEKKQEFRNVKLKEKSSVNSIPKQTLVSRISLHKPGGDVGPTESYKMSSITRSASLNLTSHLSLVKNLLNDQDTMLRDLKKLSDEMSINV